MKLPIKSIRLLLIPALLISVSSSFAADKNKAVIQCDITRSAVESAAGKIEGNKEAATDLDRARAALKYADDCYKEGKPMFGDIGPETEKEIKFSAEMADIATTTALSRVAFVRATAELEAIEKQFAAVKAKLKLFEDRKAELGRLRLEVVVCQKTSKELEAIKIEKAALTLQLEQLATERSRADKLKIEQLELARKLDEMKAENARLSGLLEKQQAEAKAQPAPTPDDPLKKTPKK